METVNVRGLDASWSMLSLSFTQNAKNNTKGSTLKAVAQLVDQIHVALDFRRNICTQHHRGIIRILHLFHMSRPSSFLGVSANNVTPDKLVNVVEIASLGHRTVVVTIRHFLPHNRLGLAQPEELLHMAWSDLR